MHVADCSSQNRCQACAHGVDRAAWSGCKPASRNPRAAIRELWASRKPQLADCSSQHRGQACAEARLQLARHRSQLADRGAGSPVPPIAACTSQLARRRLLRRLDRCSYFPPLPVLTSAAGTVQLATTRAGSPRLMTLFSSRRIADRTVADRSTLARRSRQRSPLARTLAVGWSQGAGV